MTEKEKLFNDGQDLKRGKLYLIKTKDGKWIEANFCKKTKIQGEYEPTYYYKFIIEKGEIILISGDNLNNEIKLMSHDR